ncbi:nickel-responsive transcriptional regulator NikR [Sunxiuqinia elliptica]|uniref:CopG family nickel-responsive transcriptional regulator n=1 Tax=Sunxiuqinia elliptica TaxID=655355 RepID=A0A4R6H625_9BACT|nr:nickel-responsive transcriptional regulator NikR [Sunxiuqinia elliptica]TDO03357.1 CopG family nickel-responsive transcriptional regulator [Sunxiuqinia elliptica]TDO59554.1 CopG family nickel-responsive transcriptional regulator [Sunxiuqinia elliptica]
MAVSRFGVSLEKELLDALDQYVEENHFANRSQAIRQLINRNIAEKKWQCDNTVAGSVTLVYATSRHDIQNQISDFLQTYTTEVLSSQRFLLNDSQTMEIIAIKGIAHRLTELADRLITIKGMQHGKLSMSRAD